MDLMEEYKVSPIIKGGWQLAGGHGSIDRKQAIEDMTAYADAGSTTFDCADIYTGVEELIGEFLRTYPGRKKIHVHTKFVPDLDKLSKISRSYVERIIDRSLKRLGVERLDLVQFHWWDYDLPNYVETANILKDLQKKGKIRYIGVTNFDTPRLKEIVKSGVKVAFAQVQYSVLDHRPENTLVPFCQEQGIKLLCYGTVAGGFLSERYLGVDEPQHPLENRSLTKYKLIVEEFGDWKFFQELLRTLHSIAKKHKVGITNVATRYILDKPLVAGAIIGARNKEHLVKNVKTLSLSLDQKDRVALQEIIDRSRGPYGDCYFLERIKGGKHASIMKYNLNKE